MQLPALRPTLEAVPIEHEGKPLFMLRDREELAEEALVLSPMGMLVASLLNGQSITQVRDAFSRHTGQILPEDDLLKLVEQLTKAGMLDTPDIEARRKARVDAFRALSIRPTTHHGTAYPAAAAPLRKALAAYAKDPETPARANKPSTELPYGLFAPHIDFSRGGWAYDQAFDVLRGLPPPDAIIALGVAHMSPPSPWVMTRKPYATPLGAVDIDVHLWEGIASRLGYDAVQDEYTHLAEHSLEFQAVWLKYIWGDKTPPWVPILCSGFGRSEALPSEKPSIETTIKAVGEFLAEETRKGQRFLILAGVDLSHVGPRFGDDLTLGAALEKRVQTEDLKSIEDAARSDANAFFTTTVADGHWRKVCGLTAIYTALRWLPSVAGGPVHGTMLAYGQAPDPLGGLVSFTSMRFDKSL